jgi:hypothetical protein
MDYYQPYKSSEKIEVIKRLESPIRTLKDLVDEMSEKAQKKVNLSGIERSITTIDWFNEKIDDERRWRYLIGASIHNDKDNAAIMCYAISIYSPKYSPQIKCVFRGYEFVLYDSHQSISLIKNMKDSILEIHKTLYPGVLEHMDEYDKNIYIGTAAYLYLSNPTEENPIIKIDGNKFSYDEGRFKTKMAWTFYDPYKL